MRPVTPSAPSRSPRLQITDVSCATLTQADWSALGTARFAPLIRARTRWREVLAGACQQPCDGGAQGGIHLGVWPWPSSPP